MIIKSLSLILIVSQYQWQVNGARALNIFCAISSSGWQANDTCTFSNVITTETTELAVQAPTENVNRVVFKTSALKKIPIEVFRHFPDLFALDLENNDISDIVQSNFKDAGNLKELYLGQNKIKSLVGRVFSATPKMDWLWLQNNRIEEMEEDIFEDLENLSWLRLEHNRISYLPKRIFENLHNLQRLDLSFNQLQNFEYKNLKINLPNIIEIGLESNPMPCTGFPETLNGLRRQNIKILNFNDNGATDERQVNGLPCIPDNEFVRKTTPAGNANTRDREEFSEDIDDNKTPTISKPSRQGPASDNSCCSKSEKQIVGIDSKYQKLLNEQNDVIAQLDERIANLVDQSLDLQDQIDSMNIIIKRLQNQLRRRN